MIFIFRVDRVLPMENDFIYHSMKEKVEVTIQSCLDILSQLETVCGEVSNHQDSRRPCTEERNKGHMMYKPSQKRFGKK